MAAGVRLWWAPEDDRLSIVAMPPPPDPGPLGNPAREHTADSTGSADDSDPSSTTQGSPSSTSASAPAGSARTSERGTGEPDRTSSTSPTSERSTTRTGGSTTDQRPAPPPRPDPTTTEPRSTPRSADNSLANEVVRLVNRVRTEVGCDPVSKNDDLTEAAQRHSEDMARRGYFSHTTPEGRTFDQRIRDAGYPRPGAENIAMGQTSARAVMEAWMRSDGHRRNILNCDLSAIGVGVTTSGWYWTQDFGY
ncbi:uncharacterized protein YkwD [Prauserella shujinwangii]|uniref:Uncharacterized protein YkwD n=1 Tax=Prauserella shujinwangii TaxID=1453103 RepID=A0A2T0LUS9_9PSEU|nr:CAP domain-containing protein [Prauserella shujinwangii]PRX47557.1 uncharacterized protein YkwD [Prauserella shujinwangii]